MSEKDKIITYPSFWDITILENLKKYYTDSFTRIHLILKELLDNACDAAEKFGGYVKIHFDSYTRIITVRNRGVLTEEDIENICDFNLNVSSKYQKKRFQRGCLGHGLKIAIMLSDLEEGDVKIRSKGKTYLLKLINRKAENPREVLEIQCMEDQSINEEVEISLKIPSEDKNSEKVQMYVQKYVQKYILANPHINFEYNGKSFEAKINLNRTNLDVLDFDAYARDELKDFITTYCSKDYDCREVARMFGVPRVRLKELNNEISIDELIYFIEKYKKKIKSPILGREVIETRIELLKYTHFRSGRDYVEMGIIKPNTKNFDMLNDSIICVNNSVVHPSMVRIHIFKNNLPILSPLSIQILEMKFKYPIFMFFYSTSPVYKDSNKTGIDINDPRIFKKLKSLTKTLKSQKDSKWIKYSNIKNRNELGELVKQTAEMMYSKYGPITVRQLYYQLVSKGHIENSHKSYSNLVHLLSEKRKSGEIDPFIFEDRSRYMVNPVTISVNESIEDYLKREINGMKLPKINFWDQVDYYVEIWIEKDALISIFSQLTDELLVPVFVCRGYVSISKITEAQTRFREMANRGKIPKILYFGDLDPSGWDIYRDISEKMKKANVEVVRVALNKDSNQLDDLIPMPLKSTDRRVKSFLEELKISHCYELDALDPDKLLDIARQSIKAYVSEELIRDFSSKTEELHSEFEKLKESLLSSFWFFGNS